MVVSWALKKIVPIILVAALGVFALRRYGSSSADSLRSAGSSLSNIITSPISGFFDGLNNFMLQPQQVVNQPYDLAPPPASGVGYDDYVSGADNRTQDEIDNWYTENNIDNPNVVYGPGNEDPVVNRGSGTQPVSGGDVSQPSRAGYYYQDLPSNVLPYQDQQLYLDVGEADMINSSDDISRVYFLSPTALADESVAFWGRSRGFQ